MAITTVQTRGATSQKLADNQQNSYTRATLGRSLPWLLPLLLLGMAVIAVPLLMFDPKGLPRYQALNAELQRTRNFNAKLSTDVEQLKQEVTGLRSDRLAVERIARDELGMVHEGEIVFQFEERP